MRAIGLMSFWKLRNSLRTLFTDPRKLIPVLLMLLVFAAPLGMYSFTRSMSSNMMKRAASARQRYAAQHLKLIEPGTKVTAVTPQFDPSRFTPPRPKIDPAIFTTVLTLGLLLVAVSVLNTGLGDRLLALGASDVDYLFPAPISRRVILAYRLPSLMFGALGIALYLLFMISMLTQSSDPNLPNPGQTIAPWWVNPLALFLSGGIYMNLAMFISVHVKNRKGYQQGLWICAGGFAICVAALFWSNGIVGVQAFLRSPILRAAFIPSTLAADTLIASYSQNPAGSMLLWLFVGYLASLAVLFSSNANWYEQSIASTEKWTALRQAAKGGVSGMMAAKAGSYKYKSDKTYTISPFGRHAGALFWAHLCAAAKRPLPNIVAPIIAGIALGTIGAKVLQVATEKLSASHHGPSSTASEGFVYTMVGFLAFYYWQGFTAIARTSSEASIRRRDLVSPLPIAGWKMVAADLGVPILATSLCFAIGAVTYVALGGPKAGLVAVGFGIVVPLRFAGRSVLQHIIVIAYPDLADKLQRLVSMFIGTIVGFPFLVIEAISCLPGLFLHSVWIGVIGLILIQLPLCWLFLFLAGKATERAIATGEPVRIFALFRGKA